MEAASARRRVPDDIQPVEHETLDRAITGFVTVAPIFLLFIAAWQVWNSALFWNDLVIFVIMYTFAGIGVTVGFHRLFTHRSFETTRPIKIFLAICGSMAIEGPIISWVSDHRKHHAFSDKEGDPHSPHVGHGSGWKGAVRGLLHAHVGWIFIHTERGSHERFAPDLLRDKDIVWVQKTFIFWAIFGIVFPGILGFLMSGGEWLAFATGMLWGGAVRVFVLHHVTFSINSLCHFFGRREFDTDDYSRNVFWLAIPSFGESWHNTHHAFPTSATHGLGRGQIDLSSMFIHGLEKCGLAWNVVTPSDERIAAKAL